MRLSQVPKMLSVLRNQWAPLAFCISFKVSFARRFFISWKGDNILYYTAVCFMQPNNSLSNCLQNKWQLETDSDILVQKADMALNKYKMNIVVANLLATYKEEVIIVTNDERNTIRRCHKDEDLEEHIIKLLEESHSKYIYSRTNGCNKNDYEKLISFDIKSLA